MIFFGWNIFCYLDTIVDMECHVIQCNSMNHVDTFYIAVEHSYQGGELIRLPNQGSWDSTYLYRMYPKYIINLTIGTARNKKHL